MKSLGDGVSISIGLWYNYVPSGLVTIVYSGRELLCRYKLYSMQNIIIVTDVQCIDPMFVQLVIVS